MSGVNDLQSNLPRRWEIIVIGAGPAGAVSALLLARRGKKVLLIDRASFPRSKVCGCCLNVKTLKYMRLAGLDELLHNLGAVSISRLKLCTASSALDLALPAGLSLSREALDNGIIEEAKAAGVCFLPETNALVGRCCNTDEQTSREVTISCTDKSATKSTAKTLEAQCVLVADGLNGQALSHLAEPEGELFKPQINKSSRVGAGTMIEVPSSEENCYKSGTIYMALHKNGYVGVVQTEKNKVDLAGAFDTSFMRHCGSPQKAARQILLGAGLPYLPAFDQGHWLGTAPFTRRRRKVSAERLFILGDAASYGEPFTGEGIAWAVKSALLVVPLAEAAVERWEKKLENSWQQKQVQSIGTKQKLSRGLGLCLRHEKFSQLLVGGVFKHIPALASPLVGYINR